MAYYKVPQDVEAEDKLVFGLTFKQFVFAIIFFVSGFVGFQMAKASIILLGPILPIFLISGVLAFYRPKDQPAETKLMAYINYYFRPRRRVWSRDGLLEHVVIQAPPLPQRQPTPRTQAQVRSQLKVLAQIVDTRGWASKHSEIQMPTIGTATLGHEERLIAPQEVQVINAPMTEAPAMDIFDESMNPEVSILDQREEATKQRTLETARQKMHQAKVAAESPPATIQDVHEIGTPTSSIAEPEALAADSPHFSPFPAGMQQKVLNPAAQQLAQLAKNDDATVSAVAGQAKRLSKDQPSDSELKIEH